MIKVFCAGNGARAVCDQWLTCGTVGATCEFSFDSTWDGLRKTAVFIAGDTQRDVVLTENRCVIPWEVLTQEGVKLTVGVYGVDAGGTVVVPTIYANVGTIQPGAEPGGDPSAEPTLPVWAQICSEIGELRNLETAEKNNLVAAINEVAQSGGSGGDGGGGGGGDNVFNVEYGVTPIEDIKGAYDVGKVCQMIYDDRVYYLVYMLDSGTLCYFTSPKQNGVFDVVAVRALQGYQAFTQRLQEQEISDPGNYFTADTVEGALQEIGAELAGINTLIGSGVIA